MTGCMINKPEPKIPEETTLEFSFESLIPDGEYDVKFHYDGVLYVLIKEGCPLHPVVLPKDHGMRISSFKVVKLQQGVVSIDCFKLIRPAKK